MKRILSLFLSFVLVLSMISGTIIAQASSDEPVKLIKIGYDTVGTLSGAYAPNGYTKHPKYNDGTGDVNVMDVKISYGVYSFSSGELYTQNQYRSSQNNDMYITYTPTDDGYSDLYTISGKIYTNALKADSSGDADFKSTLHRLNGNKTSAGMVLSVSAADTASFKANTWYEYEYIMDTRTYAETEKSKFTMRFKEVGSDGYTVNRSWNVATNQFKSLRTDMKIDGYYSSYDSSKPYVKYKDFKLVIDDGTSKAKIASVGSDGTNILPHSQNKVKFTLDRELPGLTKDHVLVKSRSGGNDITASSISITSDAAAPSDAQWIVEATLSQDLAAWSDYAIAISKDYYAGYKEVSGTTYIPVTDITKDFSTPSAPLDIRAPIFANDGSATTDLKSEIGNVDMTFVYTNTSSGGYIKEVTSEDFAVNGTVNGASISFDGEFVSGDTAKLFVIKGWNNPVPLFEKTWAQSYDGSVPAADEAVATSDANAGEIALGDFNYTTKKMDVNINVGSDAGSVNGVLYIYKRGTAMKDNLIYADYLTTTANGSLKKEVTFAPDITDVTGEYTVAFYSEGIKYTKDFPIYDAEANQTSDLGSVEFDMTGKTPELAYGGAVIADTYSYYPSYEGKHASFARFNKNVPVGIAKYNGEDVIVHRANNSEGTGTDGYITMFFSNEAKNSVPVSGGRYIISFDYLTTSDGVTSTLTFNRNGDGHVAMNPWSAGNPIKDNTWYNVVIEANLGITDGNNLFVTLTEKDGTHVLSDSKRFTGATLNSVRLDWDHTDRVYTTFNAFKNFKLVTFTGVNKPVIRYIGTDGVVEYDQNKVSFKISEDKGLAKENINVFDESQGTIIKAKSITVTEDMGEYFIEATLEKNLSSNKTYTLMVDAVGYEAYVEDDAGSIVPTKPISRTFTTAPAPIDITEPVITSDGSSVTFESTISNTSGSLVNATALLVVVNSDGIMQSVTADADSVANSNTGSFTNTNAFESDNTAKYFVIKDFADPKPLFKKYWTVNYDGSLPEADASVATTKAAAEKIVLNEFEYNTKFDHKNNKIVVNLNTGKNAVTEGVLYVYSDVLSDGNIVYADYVTTAADGTLLKEIKFDSSIASATKEYKVAFWSNDVEAAIEDSFNVYKAADYTNYKRNNIFANAVKSSTFSGLKQIITGTNDSGSVINDAWTIFAGDTYTADYDVLKNKEAVFVSLSSTVKSLADYDALCRAFERLSLVQKNKENTPQASNPSANNRNPGSSSVSMSATPSKPSNAGSSVGGGSVFSDMTGHWAQKHAEALVARGIVNGYADGSFRGDSPITRAELTKIIVEALDVPEKEGKNFGDVAQSSWYSSYVSRAATAGVINGFEDGSFKPEANVSRQDAVLMIWRAMNLTSELPEGFKYFADEKDIQDYASEAIRCLGDLGIVTGDKSGFKPLNNITRAEMAAVICRAIDYIESHLQ